MRLWLSARLRKILAPSLVRRLVGSRERLRSAFRFFGRLRALEAQVLVQRHPELRRHPERSSFEWAEYRVHSQNGEDGLIAYFMSRIGPSTFTFCEIGVEDGRECNTAYLARELGWSGLMIEGNAKMAREAVDHFSSSAPGRVKVTSAFVTAENIDSLIATEGFSGEVDLLAIDVDGVDYWLWKALTSLRPRMVVIEYNAFWGGERAVTVPYEPDFERFKKDPSGYYCGASLAALWKLGREKGYALVGCDSEGLNAFFIRSELAEKAGLASLIPSEAYREFNPKRLAEPLERCLARIRHLPLTEV